MMASAAYDYYRMRQDVLPARAKPRGLYVRPGRLPAYVDPGEWVLVGRASEPAPAIAAEVERRGYCAEEIVAGG